MEAVIVIVSILLLIVIPALFWRIGRGLGRFAQRDAAPVPLVRQLSHPKSSEWTQTDHGPKPPTDSAVQQKQSAIQELVQAAIIQKRRDLGVSQLMNNSPLGMAALSACQAMVEIEEPQSEQVYTDFRLAATSMGYQGVETGMAYYRQTWSLDTPNERIAQHILEHIGVTAVEELWEDWGFGLSRGLFPDRPTEFGHGVVFGVGYTDGNALVTNYINEERVKAGVQPLELNHRLRNLVREYLVMESTPDTEQTRKDILECGYLVAGFTARWTHDGVYAPIPAGSGDLHVRDVARLVADEFLRDRGDLLLRADWQDIGIAVRRDPSFHRTVPGRYR